MSTVQDTHHECDAAEHGYTSRPLLEDATQAGDHLPPRLLVLVGEGHFHKWAYLACPCGCGNPIMLSLSKTKRPAWHVGVDWLGRPTIEPSARQTAGCYSHFWLRKGRIDWCGDTGKPWRNSP
jgi:hypothetical protein